MAANPTLIQKLKDINAVILDPETSMMERYAGISELDLFPDWRKVGILTLGLFDSDSQVRELAAKILSGKFYGLGESSDAVLKLLNNDSESLEDAIDNPQQKEFVGLLSKIKPLLRKKGHYVDGDYVDCYRKHGVIILRKLGSKLREIEGAEEEAAIHPLRRLLKAENNDWILKQIQKCLKSDDVYCRRKALLLIGELDLKSDLYAQPAFDSILEILNRPENRHDYLVTKDGIEALVYLVQQNGAYFSGFCEVMRDFFKNRYYSTKDGRSDEYRYYTLQHCVEALGKLVGYQDSSVLIDKLDELLKDGKRDRFLDIMRYDQKSQNESLKTPKARNGAKRRFIEVLTKIYHQESPQENNQLRENQRKLLDRILDIIRQWVGSKTVSVRENAIGFFADLPDLRQALDYSLQTALRNHEDVKNLPGENLTGLEYSKTLVDLLAARQNIVTVINKITTKALVEEPGLIAEKGKELSQLLQDWCYQKIERKQKAKPTRVLPKGEDIGENDEGESPVENKEQLELEDSSNTRLLALWTLYNLSAKSQYIQPLNFKDTEESHQIWIEENRNYFRSVLELFRARNAGEEFLEQLRLIATGNDDELVRVCAKIELLIQIQARASQSHQNIGSGSILLPGITPSGQDGITPSGQDGITPSGQDGITPSGQDGITPSGQDAHTTDLQAEDASDLSASEVEYISKHIRGTKKNPIAPIHISLTERFIPVLAQLNQPNATQLVQRLLQDTRADLNLLNLQLREALSPYHCDALRHYLLARLLQHLEQQYKKNDELRLGYLNLLRAGEYQKQVEQSAKRRELANSSSSPANPQRNLTAQEQQEQNLKERVLEALVNIENNFETLSLPLLDPEHRIAALGSLSSRRNHTVLYATEAREIGKEQVVNIYLQNFKGTKQQEDWRQRFNSQHPLKEKYFAELLLEQGREEFKLVYLEKQDEGYIFETEQGEKF
ncbi:MAG: hypothetical protein F6K41_10620, partial [Symploca sp. SIO3E6]|nr:hypothetical protein [Caldora sp. SIO3E6]